jgi:DNA mismatch repair protein MSH6
MPLREVSAINSRLDAVEDILNHPTYEATFTEIAKGIPDLERMVSRVHAKNCRIKDFLKLLKYGFDFYHHSLSCTEIVQGFRKLTKGMIALADESESFANRTISGLLRGAPDLTPNLNNVESMFQPITEASMFL